MTSVTSTSPPYPQKAHNFNYTECINKHLTIENRDQYVGKIWCVNIVGRDGTVKGYYCDYDSPTRYITCICYIEDIREHPTKTNMTQIILTNIRVVAADYMSRLYTLTHGKGIYSHEEIILLDISRHNRTIDLRSFTIPTKYTIDHYNGNWYEWEPTFYPVPSELSTENLRIRHEQMLTSLDDKVTI
jgi:hypothetical protein